MDPNFTPRKLHTQIKTYPHGWMPLFHLHVSFMVAFECSKSQELKTIQPMVNLKTTPDI